MAWPMLLSNGDRFREIDVSDSAGEQKLSIVVEGMLVPPGEVLWQALTDPDLIARWFMPSDFEAESGHQFTFKSARSAIGTAPSKAR